MGGSARCAISCCTTCVRDLVGSDCRIPPMLRSVPREAVKVLQEQLQLLTGQRLVVSLALRQDQSGTFTVAAPRLAPVPVVSRRVRRTRGTKGERLSGALIAAGAASGASLVTGVLTWLAGRNNMNLQLADQQNVRHEQLRRETYVKGNEPLTSQMTLITDYSLVRCSGCLWSFSEDPWLR